jgi:hypothetical protein
MFLSISEPTDIGRSRRPVAPGVDPTAVRQYTHPLDPSFNLPARYRNGTIHDATIRGGRWDLVDQVLHEVAITIRPDADVYQFDYMLTPSVPGETDLDSRIAAAARLGVLEHVGFPAAIVVFSVERLPGIFLPHTYKIVPRSALNAPHDPRSSPFKPYGQWERVPRDDRGFAARLTVPQSIAPYAFFNALDRLLDPGLLHTLRSVTVAYEPPLRRSRN